MVIIPGSGPVNRDGNAPQIGLRSNSYKLLAEELAKVGIASLRIDKRGMFGSRHASPDANQVMISDYAGDVRDWVTEASKIANCVWLAGHSEGGLVALVSAINHPQDKLCGVILMAAPGRPIGTLLRSQLAGNPANRPLMPQIEKAISALELGKTVDEAQLHPALRPLFSHSVQPFLIDLFSYYPAEVASQWAGPVLILQGDADTQVGLKDLKLLSGALPQANVRILGRATHLLKRDVPGNPLATYTDPSIPLHPGVTPAIHEFLNR